MLPSGPRSTYSLPSTVQPGDRDLASQILASIRSEIERKREVRTGILTTGCDGLDVIDPLDGSSCNGGASGKGQKILFNPATRQILERFQSSRITKSVMTVPGGSCDSVIAALRARRRFTDNLGNVYGPDGAWLSSGAAAAALETDYIHRLGSAGSFDWNADPPSQAYALVDYLEKTVSPYASVLYHRGARAATRSASGDDVTASDTLFTEPSDDMLVVATPVLEDCVFGGTYTGTLPGFIQVRIYSTGTIDTFSWYDWGLSTSGGPTSITGTQQAVSQGVWVQFGATTGHSINRHFTGAVDYYCAWVASIFAGNNFKRPGVGIRGTITEAKSCVNGGFPNNNVMVGCEDDTSGAHSIAVRDADSLALLYRLTNHTGITNATGERFSFSTNDEGFFFAHFYTTDGNRKVAVISVNALTFEPTITEIITLATIAGSTFAVASTLP